MEPRVLITGATGYLGGRITTALSATGSYSVRLGTRQPFDALPAWAKHYDIAMIDIVTAKGLAEACAGVHAVVHLAALNELDSAADPDRAVAVNTLGTLHILEAAISAGAKRFVYFSTAHVYGSPMEGFVDEHTPAIPTHPYSITHREAEKYVMAAHRREVIEGLVIRLSNGFGAPAHSEVNRWTLLVNDLCRQAVSTGRIVLRSDGQQWRDFITLQDVGRGVDHFLRLSSSSLRDGLFNVGGDHSVRVIEMAEFVANRCAAVLDSRPSVRAAVRKGDRKPRRLEYSIAKLLSTGFVLKGDPAAEVDATLRLCQHSLRSVTQ